MTIFERFNGFFRYKLRCKKLNYKLFTVKLYDFKLIFLAFTYSAFIRFLMCFVKFNRYEKLLGTRNHKSPIVQPRPDELVHIDRIQKIIYSVNKYTPWEGKCMVKALSAKWLLASKGIKSTLYFGISPDRNPNKPPKLLAHAWLKVGDEFISGRKGHRRYKVVNFYS